MNKNAIKVQKHLELEGFKCQVKELPGSTRTAEEAATTIGCSVAQIAKSLIFKDKKTGNPILVIASGSNRVDIKKIQKVIGFKLSKADADYVKARCGFTIGGIPPTGHLEKLTTYLDEDLKQYDALWAAAGTPFAVFKLETQDLERMTNGTYLNLAQK
jgi:prolyl-tRNA editing enzyme YbaK/EbsC (Cys-tRNA(Pro) deacylase)